MNNYPQDQPLTGRQRLLVVIAGILFLAVGVWISGHVIDITHGFWRTRAGVTAEARVKSVEQRIANEGTSHASPSTVASYVYQVGGKSFIGSRITLFKDDFLFYRPLSDALATGKPVTVFIDPQHPDYAVVDRDLAWWPFILFIPFSLVFTWFGFLMIWHILRTTWSQ